MALFDFINQAPKTKLETSTPEYTEAVVGQKAGALRKPYQTAAKDLRQRFNSRGLAESGLAGQADMDLGQNYLSELGDAGERAAIKGADISEDRRRAQQTRDWQVQDRDMNYKMMRDQAIRRQEEANRQQWNQLISTTAGAVGSYYGGPVGGAAAKQGSQSLLDSNSGALDENDLPLLDEYGNPL